MKTIDLTIPLDEKTPVYGEDYKQVIEQIHTVEKNGWNQLRITFNTHFGTHIDAPFHMLNDGKKLTDFPIDKFIGEAIVLDVRGQKIINSDLEGVLEGDFVFFYTGNMDNACSEKFFEEFPVLSKDTANKLVGKKVSIVGLDSWTTDDSPFTIHKILLKEDILILENLINLDQLIGKRFECIIAPLKIQDADGAPCRVIARIKD